MKIVYTILRLTFELAASIVIATGVVGGIMYLHELSQKMGTIFLGG